MALKEIPNLKMKHCLDVAISFHFRESKVTCFKVTISLFEWPELGEMHFGLHLQSNRMAEAWDALLLERVCFVVYFFSPISTLPAFPLFPHLLD